MPNQQAIAKVWTFPSSSGNKNYETLQYTDGSTSCGCMGWTRRVAADGSRCCKHTRAVDMGTADSEATSFKDYQSGQTARPAAPAKPVKKAAKKSYEPEETPKAVVRKIQW